MAPRNCTSRGRPLMGNPVMGKTLASGGEARVSLTAEWRGVGGLGGRHPAKANP
jgi:hypothetical protein